MALWLIMNYAPVRLALGLLTVAAFALSCVVQYQLSDARRGMVRRGVNVIVAVGTPSTTAAKNATATTPIVMVMVSDPVRSGLASHLAYPVVDPTNSSHTDILRNLEGSARPIAVKLKSLELGRPVDADGLLTTAVHERIESRARNHLQANRSVEFRFEILI